MSNKIEIFDGETTDITSASFSVNVPDSVGLNDTDFSAYIEIFTGANGYGAGVITLLKKCGDGAFRDSEVESAAILADIPTADTGVLTLAINYKDSKEEFRLKLTGATTSDVSAYGINMKLSV